MEEKPNYFSVIPANVRYDKDLSPNAKLLYAEITSLCNSRGFCFATDDYFCQLYELSKSSIQRLLVALEQKEYIKREIIYKQGTKEILDRHIYILDPLYSNMGIPMPKNEYTPIPKNETDNNKYINNKLNNTPYNPPKGDKKFSEEFESFWKEFPKQRAGSKDKAYTSFCRVLKEKRATVEVLLKSVKQYALSDEVKKGFAKGCAAWLNDDRFNVQYQHENKYGNWDNF